MGPEGQGFADKMESLLEDTDKTVGRIGLVYPASNWTYGPVQYRNGVEQVRAAYSGSVNHGGNEVKRLLRQICTDCRSGATERPIPP